MEEAFTLTWEDATSVVQTEEVICGIDNVESILPNESTEFTDVCEEVIVQEATEEVVEQEEEVDGVVQIPSGTENIMYLTEDNVLVMEQSSGNDFQFSDSQPQFLECQVSEEVVTEQWNETCPEIIVGSEEHVGDEDQATDDVEIPLNTDQDQYAASRPYPCDFCSRRFRKKANLMNHMVAHQTDRPHGCNLCGTRYIRKTDLMTHLKIHAYIPDSDMLDEDDVPLDDSDVEKVVKRQKPPSFMRKKKNKIKLDSSDERIASSSQSYNYVDEDVRLMEAMENNRSEYTSFLPQENHPLTEPRYPITDPRKPFVCQHCGVGFAREKALASHARVHGGDSPFECQKCGEMFWDANLMREHVKNKHGGIEEDFEEEDDDYSDAVYMKNKLSDDESKFGQFFCRTCGMSFHRQDNLKRHQRVHVKEEFANENEFGHICNVCGESFPEALDLLAHAEVCNNSNKVHARGSEFRCMICGEVCADDQAVANHVRSKHGKTLTANMCMLCGRTCKDKNTLLRHSWEHSREKMFACSKCAKTFHNKARLKRHMLSHRNKVVTCDVCGEDFPDGRSLMNHRHSHSSVSGRQFPCRECGKTFGSRSSQQIHIRIHTGERPYGCRFCWKAFADGGTLRKHERIHTGEKPYACAVCPRAFNQRVVLREHIRSHHSGPDPNYSNTMTPYCCTVCSDMFATSQDLIVHLIHHCDMNTAMKRQPQVGPRKYKRRRKLKPHELELMSAPVEDEEDVENDDNFTDSEEEKKKKNSTKKSKKTPSKVLDESSYSDVYNSFSTAIESINTIMNSSKTTPKTKKKIKSEQSVPSRPKMIHTQKTRVPVESDGGKVRHKTRTLVTRTQPTELRSATGERIRPRTKNVSYHIYNSDKMQVATFPEDDIAVNNLLASDMNDQSNGTTVHFEQTQMDVGSEQTVETEPSEPEPVNITKVGKTRSVKRAPSNNSLKPGRHLIGPGDKVVRIVKGGGILVSKKKKKDEPEGIFPDNPEEFRQEMKQEDPSALHELAEISMQHAQNMFKCEMCSEVFSDRSQLLVHVPIHI